MSGSDDMGLRLVGELERAQSALVLRDLEVAALRKAIADRQYDIDRMRPVFEAAKAYRRSAHTLDPNCCAGDHDDCTARPALAALEAAIDVAIAQRPIDDVSRCAVCGWTLAETIDQGCVRGNCSHRPRLEVLYAPMRAIAEAK